MFFPNFINQFPYMDSHEMNMDWIIKTIKFLFEEMKNFEHLNKITFSDPLQWDITKQYPAFMIVSDSDTNAAYMSKCPVPKGILITDTTYWALTNSIITDVEARSDIVNILKFVSDIYETSDVASEVRYPGEYIIEDRKLYKVISEIDEGEAYSENYNIIPITIETMILELIDKKSYYTTPEMFGAKGDGTHDDTVALQAALDSKGLIICKKGKTYKVTTSLLIDSDTTFDLNGSTIIGSFLNKSLPVIKNKNYGTTGVTNISIINGTIQGIGADSDVAGQGHAIALWMADTVSIKDIFTVNTCGDGLGMRGVTNAVIQNVDIGNYGRNAISPTSGSFVFENVKVSGVPFTGANPGRGLDAEINNADEKVKCTFINCAFPDMTFVDFHSSEGSYFPFELSFNNVTLRGKPFGLRFLATNKLKAKNIIVNNVQIDIIAETGKTITVENVSGLVFDSVFINHVSPSTANVSAFNGNYKDTTFRNMDLSMFTGNGYSIRGVFENCYFENVNVRVYATNGFSNNRFVNSIINSYRGTDADDTNNIFIETSAPDELLTANNHWNNTKSRTYTLTSVQSLKLTRTSANYAYLMSVRVGSANNRSLYMISGRSYGEARNVLDKILGNDSLTAEFDESSYIITLSNATENTITVSVTVLNGDIPIPETITPE